MHITPTQAVEYVKGFEAQMGVKGLVQYAVQPCASFEEGLDVIVSDERGVVAEWTVWLEPLMDNQPYGEW